MRGRVSAGMLRMIGMPESVARSIDDYVSLGVRIARDPAWRAELKARVMRDRERLYRDRAPIVALEEFLERAAHRAAP
jgi:protein O-GlcNAc transferase